MIYLAFAFAIGCMIPLQAAINNQLKSHVADSTVMASFVSFAVGTLALAAFVSLSGARWRALTGLADAKAWQLTGGLLGAVFVFGTTLLVPKIGAAKMVALILAGQVLVSLLLDHNGWIGLATREITPLRIAGAILVVAGVVLVNYEQLFVR
jgi:transporter family-2 protein